MSGEIATITSETVDEASAAAIGGNDDQVQGGRDLADVIQQAMGADPTMEPFVEQATIIEHDQEAVAVINEIEENLHKIGEQLEAAGVNVDEAIGQAAEVMAAMNPEGAEAAASPTMTTSGDLAASARTRNESWGSYEN